MQKNLKGKEAVFKCTVHEIKAKELPEIDDEFAAEVSEFDTLEEYKADVKAKIKEQKAADGKRNQEDQAVEQAVKNAEYEIPEANDRDTDNSDGRGFCTENPVSGNHS